MQYVVIVPNKRKRITLLPNVSAKFIDQQRREIVYITTDLTTLIWQLLVNMPEREAVKLLAAIEMEDNDQ